MAKILAVLYGVVCHVMFLLVFLYLICFLGNFNFDPLVPKTIDSGTPGPVGISGSSTACQHPPAGALRRSPQCDGAPGVQAVVDPVRAQAGGAEHLCLAIQPVGDPVVLAVATDDGRGVGGSESTRGQCALGSFFPGLWSRCPLQLYH